jgi:hypothetical protein
MAWVESTEDWRQVPKRLLASLVLIVVAGVGLGYAVGLLISNGLGSLGLPGMGAQQSGQDEEALPDAGTLPP